MKRSAPKFLYLNLCYILALAVTFCLLYKFQFIYAVPNNTNLLNWDANWYNSIRTNGYEFLKDAQCNLAFFPLFPLIWNLLHLSPIGISLFNGILFQTSFYLLFRKEKFNWAFFIFLMTIPSLIFFYLPYSESLFFFFSTLVINGYRTRSEKMKLAGLFFASMARSVSVIFVPAIIICEFLVPSPIDNWRKRTLRAFNSCLSSAAGLGFTVVFQGLQTGKWFYFTAVMKYWDRKWILPKFPLTTHNPSKILAIDGLAFMTGLIAILLCIKWAVEFFIIKAAQKRTVMPSHIVFCALFLSAITILDTIHTNNLNNSANLWSLNRHLTATAFSLMFLHWLHQHYKPGKYENIFWIFLLIAGVFITGIFQYPLLTVYYAGFFGTFLYSKFYPGKKWSLMIPLACQLCIQLMMLEEFLWYKWVG